MDIKNSYWLPKAKHWVLSIVLIQLLLISSTSKVIAYNNEENVDEIVRQYEKTKNLEPLIEALGAGNTNVRNANIKALKKIGNQAVKPLVENLEDIQTRFRQGSYSDVSRIRLGIIYTLGEIGNGSATSILKKLSEYPDKSVKSAASSALHKISNPQTRNKRNKSSNTANDPSNAQTSKEQRKTRQKFKDIADDDMIYDDPFNNDPFFDNDHINKDSFNNMN